MFIIFLNEVLSLEVQDAAQTVLNTLLQELQYTFTVPGTDIGFNFTLFEDPVILSSYADVLIDGTAWD